MHLREFIVYEDTWVKGQLLIYEDINIVSVYYYQRELRRLTLSCCLEKQKGISFIQLYQCTILINIY